MAHCGWGAEEELGRVWTRMAAVTSQASRGWEVCVKLKALLLWHPVSASLTYIRRTCCCCPVKASCVLQDNNVSTVSRLLTVLLPVHAPHCAAAVGRTDTSTASSSAGLPGS